MNQRLPLGKRSQEGKVLVAITTVLSQQNLYFKITIFKWWLVWISRR